MLGKLEPPSQVWIQSTFFFFFLQEPRARNVNWLFRGMSILVPKFHLISSLSGTSAAGASQDDLRHAGTALTLGWAGLTTPLTWLAQPYVRRLLLLGPQPQLRVDFAGRVVAPASFPPTQTNALPHREGT